MPYAQCTTLYDAQRASALLAGRSSTANPTPASPTPACVAIASGGSGAHERRRLSAARSARGAVGPGAASGCGTREASVWSPPQSSTSFSSPPHCTPPRARGDRPVRDLSRAGHGRVRCVSSCSYCSPSSYLSSSFRAAAAYTCVGWGVGRGGWGGVGTRGGVGWGGGRAELSLSLSLALALALLVFLSLSQSLSLSRPAWSSLSHACEMKARRRSPTASSSMAPHASRL
jgi:hypothetical protein